MPLINRPIFAASIYTNGDMQYLALGCVVGFGGDGGCTLPPLLPSHTRLWAVSVRFLAPVARGM